MECILVRPSAIAVVGTAAQNTHVGDKDVIVGVAVGPASRHEVDAAEYAGG